MLVIRVAVVVATVVVSLASNFVHNPFDGQNYWGFRTVAGNRNSLLEIAHALGVIHHFDACFLAGCQRLFGPFWNCATAASGSVGDHQRFFSFIGEDEFRTTVSTLVDSAIVMHLFCKLDNCTSVLCNGNGKG